jgi:hypothetical protein
VAQRRCRLLSGCFSCPMVDGRVIQLPAKIALGNRGPSGPADRAGPSGPARMGAFHPPSLTGPSYALPLKIGRWGERCRPPRRAAGTPLPQRWCAGIFLLLLGGSVMELPRKIGRPGGAGVAPARHTQARCPRPQSGAIFILHCCRAPSTFFLRKYRALNRRGRLPELRISSATLGVFCGKNVFHPLC